MDVRSGLLSELSERGESFASKSDGSGAGRMRYGVSAAYSAWPRRKWWMENGIGKVAIVSFRCNGIQSNPMV